MNDYVFQQFIANKLQHIVAVHEQWNGSIELKTLSGTSQQFNSILHKLQAKFDYLVIKRYINTNMSSLTGCQGGNPAQLKMVNDNANNVFCLFVWLVDPEHTKNTDRRSTTLLVTSGLLTNF